LQGGNKFFDKLIAAGLCLTGGGRGELAKNDKQGSGKKVCPRKIFHKGRGGAALYAILGLRIVSGKCARRRRFGPKTWEDT